MIRRLKSWWEQDRFPFLLLIGGFFYAWFFSQGIPLWDDDFTSWFWKIKDKSIFTLIFELVSPISTQPQYWGFNERPIQAIVYKLCYFISGYESWSYFLYKSLVYGGLGSMIYLWTLRLVPNTQRGHLAAFAAAVFFFLTPGPMAAHVMHQDLAPTAELLFLLLTYFIWDGIEKTPASWSGMPKWSNIEHRQWLKRWALISVLTFLAYKSKADLKMVPVVLTLYLLAARRHQTRFFAIPVALMVFLAIPWGPGIFTKLPPFVPGSKGSEIGWMWQPASFGRMFHFLWNPGMSVRSFGEFMHFSQAATISLTAVLGPWLLCGILFFIGTRIEGLDKIPWTIQESARDRARTFALIWFLVMLVSTSALPEINYIFRIRYGILTAVPASILLAWLLSFFTEAMDRLPKWGVALGVGLFALQSGTNLVRSVIYRRDMGQVMIAVDQAYDAVNRKFGNYKLALLDDFRAYDYRPDAAPAFAEKDSSVTTDDLVKKYQPFKTYVITWNSQKLFWDQLELVEHFSGCRETSLFDKMFCPPASGTGAYLMRYIGSDPLYTEGEALRSKGDIAGARKLHEEYVAKYPLAMAGHFVLGLESSALKDWEGAHRAYVMLEKYFPTHLSVLYNHALVLAEKGKFDDAIARFNYIIAQKPTEYAAFINLYWAYVKNGQEHRAQKTLAQMKKLFPEDKDVNRLIASQKS